MTILTSDLFFAVATISSTNSAICYKIILSEKNNIGALESKLLWTNKFALKSEMS